MLIVGEVGATLELTKVNFDKKLNSAHKQGKKVAVDLSRSFVKSSDRIAAGLKKIDASSFKQAGSVAKQFGGEIKGTTMAVTNFNRIVQDAPFGILGVSNNLEPMIQSFNKLKSQTGTTTGALKTLLTSAFTGPGALITTVSLASTLLIAFGDDLFSAGQDAEGAEELLSGLNTEIDVMTRALDKFSQKDDPFGLESMKNELLAISAKESVLTDLRDRFNELTVEADMLHEQLRYGVLDKEEARRAVERLGNISSELVRINNEYGTQAQIETELEAIGERKVKTTQELNRTQAALTSEVVEEARAKSESSKAEEKQLELIKQINKDNTKASALVVGLRTAILELRKEETREIQKQNDLEGLSLGAMPEDVEVDTDVSPAKGSIADLQMQLRAFQNMRAILEPGSQGFRELTASIEETRGKLNELRGAGETGAQGLNVSAAAADVLGNALAQAVVRGEELGGVLKSLAAQLASRALINGLGMLLTGGSFSIGKLLFGGFRASGGPVSGGSSYIVGERGPELFTPSSSGMIHPNSAVTAAMNGSANGAAIEQAFSRALSNHTSRLGPREVLVLTKEGEYLYGR